MSFLLAFAGLFALLSGSGSRREKEGNEIICVIVKSESFRRRRRLASRARARPFGHRENHKSDCLTACLVLPLRSAHRLLCSACHVCPSRHFTTLNGGEELKEGNEGEEKRRFVSARSNSHFAIGCAQLSRFLKNNTLAILINYADITCLQHICEFLSSALSTII